MTGKDLFKVWAPQSFDNRWARFAKPALFVGLSDYRDSVSVAKSSSFAVPDGITRYVEDGAAFIVDLPGASSVESGLALAQLGVRPVPLYNGVHEKNIGGLREVVDNSPIINALADGALALKDLPLEGNARPAFLLDYNRNQQVTTDTLDMYDNRWSIELDDMPDTSYLHMEGIRQIVVWSNSKVHDDLLPILDSYRDAGINVAFYTSQTQTSGISPKAYDDIRIFENARVALMLIAGMALLNLFFQFFVREEPLLWTAPIIQWLTYLWIPEIVGDVIAVFMTSVYVVLYFMSSRRRNLITAAFGLFGLEVAVFAIYVVYYGVASYTGYSFWYGVVVFGFPALCFYLLVKGVAAWKHIKHMDDNEYYTSLDEFDDTHFGNDAIITRRRHFRGFRGYGGYGGSGRGGYRGGGYRGYGGGYGGGFGG